jgi:septal ring factor EnvC (AmiA/AmiB activator)
MYEVKNDDPVLVNEATKKMSASDIIAKVERDIAAVEKRIDDLDAKLSKTGGVFAKLYAKLEANRAELAALDEEQVARERIKAEFYRKAAHRG